MYKNLVTSDSVMNQLIKEHQQVADAEEKLDITRVKLSDFISQCNGFKSSLEVHENNLKELETQANAINRNLDEKENIVSELRDCTKGLVEKVAHLQNQVSEGKGNMEKILKVQTDGFLKLDNLDDEKFELEQKQEEQKKLILEAPAADTVGFFEKIKRRGRSSLLQGELNKLSNQIQNKQTNWQEMNAKLERLKARRKEQDLAIKNDLLMIASTEETIRKNGEILETHCADAQRLRNKAQEVSFRHRIETDKVTSLREQIVKKEEDIVNCSNAVVELEQTIAKRKAIIIEKKKTHEDMSDEVTLAIFEED